jgi:hypothetical protein
MSVEVRYLDPANHHTIVARLNPPWTLREWLDGLDKIVELGKDTAVCYVIYDGGRSVELPSGFIANLPRMRDKTIPHVKRRIVIGPRSLLTTLVQVVSVVIPIWAQSLAMVNSMDEALALIHKWREQDA